MPDRVLGSFVAAVSGHLIHRYHQTAGDLDGLQATLHWVRERLYAHPAFLRLPLLACEATAGDPANVISVAAAWHLFHCAAHLLDSVADEAFPAQDLAGGGDSQPGPIGAMTSRVVNNAVTLLFLAQVSLTTLRRNRVDSQRVVSVVAAFNTAATRMALGQARDLAWDEDAGSLDDYWRVAGTKTGEFFGLACRAGAMLGADDQAEIDIYGSFGYHLGVLVQLGDDLQALWKPRDRGDVITAGRTLPVVYARTVAPSTIRDQLHTLLHSLRDDPGALRQLQTMLADLGALHYLMLQAGSQHHLAHEALLSSTRPSVAQHELSRLLDIADVTASGSDGAHLMPIIERTEAETAVTVERVLGDGAYGWGKNRAACAERDEPIDLVSPSAQPTDPEVHKSAFTIDLEAQTATCPQGHTITGKPGPKEDGRPTWLFTFPRATCEACALFKRCVRSKKAGRSVRAGPYEAYLQKARARQQTEAFDVVYRLRPAVERKIGDLVRHGLRHTRYIGESKR